MAEKFNDPHRRFTICTLEGFEFDFLNPDPEIITLENIAEGLSKAARYGGQTPGVFYSVAEHSVLCSYRVPEHCALQALMHDAAEAYTGDFANPLKRMIHAQTDILKVIDDRITRAIFEKFQIEPDSDTDALCSEVHDADTFVFIQERNQLMPEAPWWSNYGGGDPDYTTIRCNEWRMAKGVFIRRFNELFYGLGIRKSTG